MNNKIGDFNMSDAIAERNHKSSVFTSLFSDKEKLLELYNAIEGTSHKDTSIIDINTLPNVLFLNQQNDISFIIGEKVVVLIEHQSSISENMPIRLLMYIGRVYEKIVEKIDKKAIYKKKLVKVPVPEFIVLYNGEEEFPDEKVLKLSEAFHGDGGLEGQLELKVRVLNINKGRNIELSQKCESLFGYSEFIAKIREFESQGYELADAIKKAILYCMKRNILLDYLNEYSSEILNMLYTEFNMEDAKSVWREEGREDGIAEGIAVGEAKMEKVFALLEKGVSLAEVKKQLGLK
jgi:hypothetical protein